MTIPDTRSLDPGIYGEKISPHFHFLQRTTHQIIWDPPSTMLVVRHAGSVSAVADTRHLTNDQKPWMFRVDWGILPSYVGIVVKASIMIPIKQPVWFDGTVRKNFVAKSVQEVIHGKSINNNTGEEGTRSGFKTLCSLLGEEDFRVWEYVSDVLLTTTCLASWKRYHIVLFKKNRMCSMWFAANSYGMFLHLRTCICHWDFAFQNGSRMASILNLVCLLCLACCIGILRQFCFLVAEALISQSSHRINRGWWRFPPRNTIGLFSVILLYFLAVSVAYLNSKIPVDIRLYFSLTPYT